MVIVVLGLTLSIMSFVLGRESPDRSRARSPILIAHRGASAYAPEHTLAAYETAIGQGADFVEQDLQITRDGFLICAHDAELSRTTNVAEIFPDRARTRSVFDLPQRGWYAVDLTLEELRRLQAGAWFNRQNPFAASPEFEDQTIPTLKEAIDRIGGRAGLYIELKGVEFYDSFGLDMVAKLTDALQQAELSPSSVMIQSFSQSSLIRLREMAPQWIRVQLLPMTDPGREGTGTITDALAAEVSRYAQGVGPDKEMLTKSKDLEILHAHGLFVHPYTFRGSTSAVRRLPLDGSDQGKTVREMIIEEMLRYMKMGIDGGFTDYPDLWHDAVAISSR